uniref:Uncharacterized protein n=1 Tax=Ditylenchus dipsaci TaxID=166011 RepID=A0A915CLM6_9BILA
MPNNVKGSSSSSTAASASSDAADERRSKLPLSTARYRSASITPSSHTRNSEGSKYDPSLQKYRPSTLYTPSTTPSSSSTNSGTTKPSMTSSTPSSLSIGLRRSATATGDVTDMSRSSDTNSTSSNSSRYSSIKNIRRPYGLMKVQSTSAVEKKPSQMSIRVISMN